MATNHGAIATFTDANTVDIANLLLTLAQSIEPGVVGYYANNTARDAGTLALRNAGVKGFKAFVLAPPSGDSPAADWCGWNGSEWIWENPTPVTYNSGTIAGTSINYTTPSGHSPSVHTFTPTRSGFAEVRLYVNAQSGVAGYGSGFLRPRFSSGTLLPGGNGFTVMDERAALTRQDTFQHYPVPIYLTKGVATSLAFDLWSNSLGSGAFWQLVNAQWLITQT
jgi:hypothetical protein